jgi:uncharacterized protein YjdB
VTPGNATDKTIAWTSSAPAIAGVDAKGLVTGHAAGSAVIAATSLDGPGGTTTVTVLAPAQDIALTGISLNPSSLNLSPGGTAPLTVVYNPATTTRKEVAWSSSNTNVAIVSGGTVVAVGGGTAIITAASTADPSKTASAIVTVAVPLTGISLSPNPLMLTGIGTTGSLAASYTPSDTTQTGISWSSSNTAVATVANGTVTAAAGGTATITATSTANNTIIATATVNITVPLTGISLSPSSLAFTGRGDTGSLTVAYAPAATTQTGVTWSSSNPAVATVSNGTVTATGSGTATITATSTTDNTISASATVTVPETPLTGISLAPNLLTLTGTGTTGSLAVIYSPNDTTQTGISWSSSNTTVATISNGTVTAAGGGTATITATSTSNNTISANVTVNVIIPVTGLALDKTTMDLNKEGTDTLSVTYTPTNTTQQGVIWSSSNTAVATVSNGTVTATGGGNATITATSTADNTKTANCVVTVTVPVAGISLLPGLTMGVGSAYPFTVSYTPSDTIQTGISWSSSNTDVATVSDGIVTAAAVGNATITATSTVDGTISASCNVTVQASFSGAVVTIVFEGLEDETITLDTTNGSYPVVITAPDGFDRYLWYEGGSYIGTTTTPTMMYPYNVSTPGRYYITVIVEKDGNHFSKTLIYTVGY